MVFESWQSMVSLPLGVKSVDQHRMRQWMILIVPGWHSALSSLGALTLVDVRLLQHCVLYMRLKGCRKRKTKISARKNDCEFCEWTSSLPFTTSLASNSQHRGSIAFCQESGGGCGNDEARLLVGVRALCSLQCFDTVGWVAGRTSNW